MTPLCKDKSVTSQLASAHGSVTLVTHSDQTPFDVRDQTMIFRALTLALFATISPPLALGNEDDVFEKGCRTYGLPQLEILRSNSEACHSLLRRDSDGDGTPDWTNTIDGRRGAVFIPYDLDMDNDGIENILDIHPLTPEQPLGSNSIHAAPLSSASKQNTDIEINRLKSRLYQKTGVLALDFPEAHTLPDLQTLQLVLESGLPEQGAQKLTQLRVVYRQPPTASTFSAQAYYVRDLRAIVLSTKTTTQQILPRVLASTLAHELGHAAAFSLLTGDSLAQLAQSYGPWKKATEKSLENLWDHSLLQVHPNFYSSNPALLKMLHVPSRYALTNIHEWFAEVFSEWVMRNLEKKGVVEKSPSRETDESLSGALRGLFDTKSLATSEHLQPMPR